MIETPPTTSGRVVHNRREISVFGIKRSGNHAFIGWLIRELAGRIVHLNDVTGGSPYETCSEIKVKGLPASLCRPTLWNRTLAKRNAEIVRHYSARDPRVDREAIRNYGPKDALILSYEDRLPGDQIVDQFHAQHDAFVGPSTRACQVLILRDAHNLFASLLRASFPRTTTLGQDVESYKRNARLFMEVGANRGSGLVCVSFNEWFQSAAYRKQTAEALGFTTDGSPFQWVSRLGAGSSFDGVRLNGRAQNMRVLERWKQCENDPRYQAALSDPELLDLTKRIFGHVKAESAA